MKFSEQWLREWVNPAFETQKLVEQLTMLGLEVDSVDPVVPPFSGVIVGEVLEAVQHPDADRLRVCKVKVGQGEILTIVCGGRNVRAQLKVPVAQVGAVLPGDFKIKKAKIRGVESSGMICSESELGLVETSDGIMELPADAPIGADFREYMHLNDTIIDIDLTPNRGDCLSILGVAREIAAANRLSLNENYNTEKAAAVTTGAKFKIKVESGQNCPRYIGRVIKNIRSDAKSPLWLQEKLRRSDIRSIHPVVDITNFVMLELGQPLHAFDLDKLDGEIIVRLAKPGETAHLLDEQNLELDDQTLVIADQQGVQAIAGIKGASSTSVTSDTQNLFLESAFFTPNSITRTARRYGIFTDSGQRFERGVDPYLQQRAIERATQLITEILGGEVGPLNEITFAEYLPKSPQIFLGKQRIERILGVSLDSAAIESILKSLNMHLQEVSEGWKVTPPSYRFDLKLEVDLIEELARLYGYDHIPSTFLDEKLKAFTDSESQLNLRVLRTLMKDLGYSEAVTYSFVDPKIENLFATTGKSLHLVNPLSPELSVMRSSHMTGLIQVLIYNEARQQDRVRLFELGLCFKEEEGGITQQLHLGAIVSGSVYSEQWGAKPREIDFFDIKSDLENILRLAGYEKNFKCVKSDHKALHPGKSARIFINDSAVGYIGCLHPEILQKLDLSHDVFLIDLNLDKITNSSLPSYQMFSKFPMIKRDIAFTVEKSVPVEEILKKILDSAGELLKNVNVFDVYQGKGIAEGKKSIAFGLIYQHDTRTLVDAEVNDNIQHLINVLQTEFNATLRD